MELQRDIIKRKIEGSNKMKVTVSNTSKAMLPIQIRKPGSDFYIGERSIYLMPGKSYIDYEENFNFSQISNLSKQSKLKIVKNS